MRKFKVEEFRPKVFEPENVYQPTEAELFENYVVTQLEECCLTDDLEVNHIRADELLCAFLNRLGYSRVVRAYEGVVRWHA